MKGHLRISGRVSVVGSTVPGTVRGRSSCGTGQGGVVGSTKIAIVLLIMVLPDASSPDASSTNASSTKLCIPIRLLLALPEWRLLFTAGRVSVPRAWTECPLLLVAPV